MKKIIFFITHKTLSYDHARTTLFSIAKQSKKTNDKFDKLYIYNSHSNELSNEKILTICQDYHLMNFFNSIEIFRYDNTSKTLGGDISSIKTYLKNSYHMNDRVLLLKSDSILSKNYFDTVFNISEGLVYFVAPFICAKKRVSDNEILEYSERDSVVFSDEITFFVEDSNNTSDYDFNKRKDITVTDESIKFTSCYVVDDFSCHYISVGLMDKIRIAEQSWGGVNFRNLRPHLIQTDKCFVIHKFHDIVSENRSTDREGPVKTWLNS
jgi:hypothetical protein